MLHLGKQPPAAFAKIIALAGGANRNAGRIWCAVVPSQPRIECFFWHGALAGHLLLVKNQERINFGQCSERGGKLNAIRRGAFDAPIIDRRFNIADVNANGFGTKRIVGGVRHGRWMITLAH